jgi:O-antigen/teichoic acid export membrane protein
MTVSQPTAVSRRTTATSLVWSAVENGGLAVISFVSLIVYLRLLSATDFGLYASALALVEMLGVVVTMLFHHALVQRRELTELHFDTAFSATMILSVLMALACWALSPLFALLVHEPSAARVLTGMALVFPCSGISATLVARQRRELEFRALAMRSLIGRLLGGGIGIAAALLGAGLWSLVLQQILIAAISSAVLWASAARRPRLRFGVAEFRQLIGFGTLSVGGLLLASSVRRLYTILASFLLGVQTAGYLNLSFRVVDVFWAIAATAVSQVALPMLAGLQTDPVRFKRAYQAATQFACLALYPAFLGLASVGPEVVEVLFGRRWLPSAPYVRVLGFLVLVQAPRLLITPVLTALGRPRDPLVALAAELLFMLGITASFGMSSLPGAIGVWVASECVLALVSTWILRRATGYGVLEQFRGVRKPMLASVLMAAAVIETGFQLPQALGALPRLAVLLTVGVIVFVTAAAFLDRRLVGDFLGFVRSGFGRKWKEAELP